MSALPPYLPARRRYASFRSGRSVRPIPGNAWAVSLVLALLVAAGIVFPMLGLALAALAAAAFVASRVVARPVSGLVLALCIFPLYPLLRGVALLYRLPVPLSVAGMWPELVLTVVFAGIVIAAIKRRERLRLYWDDLPVVVLLLGGIYGVAMALAQREVMAAIYGFHYSITALLFYVAARWARPTEGDVRRVTAVLLITYVCLALPSLLDYALRTDIGVRLSMALRPGFEAQAHPLLFWKTYARMQSLLFDENVWGSLSALVSLFCLASFSAFRPALATRLLFSVATLCVLLSMSRGSMACWLAGASVLLLLRGRHRPRIVLAFLALSLMIGAGVWMLRQDRRVEMLLIRVVAVRDSRSDAAFDNLRREGWKQGLDRFRDVPSGDGIGTAGQAAMFHGRAGVVSDGQYFKVAAEQGVPGLVTLALGIAGILWVIVRHLPGASGLDRVVGMTAAAYLCGLCAQSVGSNALDFYYTPAVLWTLVGCFVARRVAAPSEYDR